jgi:hypothetical protein
LLKNLRCGSEISAHRAFFRAPFTGVKKDGKQGIVILSRLALDHVQRRDFLIWLCRTEQFIAYAYGAHVGIADSASNYSEGVDIYASSDSHDVIKSLSIDIMTDGTFKIFDRHDAVMSASPENGIFLGLQRSTSNISGANQQQFRELWRDMAAEVTWRQR